MSPDLAFEEMELDRAWREAEILALQNIGAMMAETQSHTMRRALTLVVYAHAEGFTKFALSIYVRAINETNLTCADVKAQIAAATLTDELKKLRDPMAKHPEFKDDDERDLHSLFVETQFVNAVGDLWSKQVRLPDSAVNTADNLWPQVLKKNLYRLGLPDDRFRSIYASLHKLVNKRNGIGHGADRDGVEPKDYQAIRDCAFELMRDLQGTVFSAISLSFYRKTHAPAS